MGKNDLDTDPSPLVQIDRLIKDNDTRDNLIPLNTPCNPPWSPPDTIILGIVYIDVIEA